MKFEHRVVLITGASSGIGEALALEFAREGAHLVLCARREERLEVLCKRILESGRRAIALRCDVTREGELDRALAAAVAEFGRLDIAVANAGFGVVGSLSALSLEDYRRQFETNVFGLLRTAKACLPELEKTRGSLVLMGSVSGHLSIPGTSPYSMSKFAVRALADAAYFELRPKGVAVTLISPGFVESEIRQVDNFGVRHPEGAERIPRWIVMPVDVAARKMLRAIGARRRELVLTGHGKIAVFVKNYFPWLIRAAVRWGLQGRREPRP